MPLAGQSTINFITEYFALMEAKDYDRLSDYLADNVT